MVDTFRPLDLGDAAIACEDAAYAWTWAAGRGGGGARGTRPEQGPDSTSG